MSSILLLISGLFVAALLIRHLWLHRLCAICFSVAVTWIFLLLLYRLDRWHDPVLLALLMGQSITAIYYQLRPRLNKSLQIFTLPFFLSLTAGFYMLIMAQLQLWVLALLLIIWVLAYLALSIHLDKPRSLLSKAIDCCEDK